MLSILFLVKEDLSFEFLIVLQDQDNSADFEPIEVEESDKDEKLKRNFKEYNETISMALRCRINSNKLSLILNCFCLDNDMDESEFLSPEKLRTAMIKHGKKVVEKHEQQKR